MENLAKRGPLATVQGSLANTWKNLRNDGESGCGEVRSQNRGGGKFNYLMPLVFKVLSIKGTYFWAFLLNDTVYLIEFTKFKSLCLVNFQASVLAKSHHLLVKLSCKSACENIDGFSARSEACLLQPILQLSKKSSCPPL